MAWLDLRPDEMLRGGADETTFALTIVPKRPDDATGDRAAARAHLRPRPLRQDRLSVCASRCRIALDLSFTARIGTLLVGSVRLSPIRIGETKALLLGPLTVEPPFRERGVGQALIERALKEAAAKGHRLVMLVGDEPYYGKAASSAIPPGRVDDAGPGRSGAASGRRT